MQLFHFYVTFFFLFTLIASCLAMELRETGVFMKTRYYSEPELTLLEAAKKGDLATVCQSLLKHRFEQDILDRCLFRAIENDSNAVVERLFEIEQFSTQVLHFGLILAGMKNAGSTLALFLQTGRYDPADLRLAYSAALTNNSSLAMRALLVHPTFVLTEPNRQAAIEHARENKRFEVLAVLETDRKKLQEEDSGLCIVC
jgi:hypothetical protein